MVFTREGIVKLEQSTAETCETLTEIQTSTRKIETSLSTLGSSTDDLSDTAHRADNTTSRIEQSMLSLAPAVRSISHDTDIVRSDATRARVAIENLEILMQNVQSRLDKLLPSEAYGSHAPAVEKSLTFAMAKTPSYLRDRLDDLKHLSEPLSNLQTRSSTHRAAFRSCGCPIETLRHQTTQRGPFRSTREVRQTHLPSCKHFKKASSTRTWRVTLAMRVLFWALDLSFKATSGAGGYGLWPGIAVTRPVDRNKQASFTIFEDLKSCSSLEVHESWLSPTSRRYPLIIRDRRVGWYSFRWEMTALEDKLEFALETLQALFDKNEASPLDTDIEGRTPLHVSAVCAEIFCSIRLTQEILP
jgi:hypothetical protein